LNGANCGAQSAPFTSNRSTNRDRVVSKDDLIASIWGGRIVSESTLTSRINAARNAVGDNGRKQQLIRTIPRKGLRFIGAVHTQVDDNTPNQVTDPPPDEIRDVSRPALLLPDRPAIAVLPFTNMSGDPEREYFSDGISEDIITALSKLRWFFVIARNSSFVYKGKAVHMKQVAEELGVGYVVEGSVRKCGVACGSQRSSTMSQPAATSGRSVTTATLPTFSLFRMRSPNPSSQRLSRSCTLPRIFAPDASRPAVSMPGIW